VDYTAINFDQVRYVVKKKNGTVLVRFGPKDVITLKGHHAEVFVGVLLRMKSEATLAAEQFEAAEREKRR
jgi:hypothetical protein